MPYSRITVSLIIASLSILTVYVFWPQPIVAGAILGLLALIKHKTFPLQHEFKLFLFSGVLGALGEKVAIAGGAWQYPNPQLFGIPIYLPFLWGLTGITGITFYEGIKEILT